MEIRWKKIEKLCFFNRPLPVSFPFILVVSIQLMVNKIYRWLDSNCGSLVTEATTLPAEPQPLALLLVDHVLIKNPLLLRSKPLFFNFCRCQFDRLNYTLTLN